MTNRPESRTHVAEMTEVIATEANKRELKNYRARQEPHPPDNALRNKTNVFLKRPFAERTATVITSRIDTALERRDLIDPHSGIELAVAGLATGVLTSTEFLDDQLLAHFRAQYFGRNLRPLHRRRPHGET